MSLASAGITSLVEKGNSALWIFERPDPDANARVVSLVRSFALAFYCHCIIKDIGGMLSFRNC
jgi:hypothetical protein